MKHKLLAHSILWAGLLIGTSILYGDTERYFALLSMLVTCATVSIAILACPDGKKDEACVPQAASRFSEQGACPPRTPQPLR